MDDVGVSGQMDGFFDVCSGMVQFVLPDFGRPYNVQDLRARLSWVGSVLYRSCTTYRGAQVSV